MWKSVFGRHVATRTFAQSPVHDANFHPFAGTACSVSRDPAANVLPHFGVQVTVPLPVLPSTTGTRVGPNVAVTETAPPSVTLQSALPVQAPVQPTNRLPREACATSAVSMPPSHCVVHDVVQLT